jgi:hypothetical protein
MPSVMLVIYMSVWNPRSSSRTEPETFNIKEQRKLWRICNLLILNVAIIQSQTQGEQTFHSIMSHKGSNRSCSFGGLVFSHCWCNNHDSNLLLETMLLLWTHNFSHLISVHFPIRSYLLSDVLATSSVQSNKGEQLQACATCSKIQQVSALPRPTVSTTKLGHVERKKFCPMELLRVICITSIQEPCNCRLQRE